MEVTTLAEAQTSKPSSQTPMQTCNLERTCSRYLVFLSCILHSSARGAASMQHPLNNLNASLWTGCALFMTADCAQPFFDCHNLFLFLSFDPGGLTLHAPHFVVLLEACFPPGHQEKESPGASGHGQQST
eukprot:1155590-Pelagomonas_calceolata.AAC.3